MERLKERAANNVAAIGHDAIGNYINFNGIKIYQRTVAMSDGDSATVSGDTAPASSILFTSHDTGKGNVFVSDGTNLQILSQATGSIPVTASGQYVPSFTGSSNIDSITGEKGNYMRVGNVVFVTVPVRPVTTLGAGTETEFDISLPIPSNLAFSEDASGVFGSLIAEEVGKVGPNLFTHSTVTVAFLAGASGGGPARSVSFSYFVR